MNKTELVEKVAESAGLTKTQAEAAINAFVETITDGLKAGDKITLKGFGTFEVRQRDAREGRNPRTGETMTIAASKAPAFKASSALKNVINGK
ncbi:MAG: HU family DNA-binding protein [Coprobacillus cateniformis]|uniref:HU family DNA-binding protein n=1 Tax=Longibaculum muris TaxID=1796628 RepID=UPI003AB460C7|nr:HU family DNA-binding protein [Coprobacillus cateniformis]